MSRHLPGAIKGDDRAVHQARVASRRLRESVPVLSQGLKGSKASKALRKIRRLTGALGMVRELDVALQMLDGLAGSVPRPAIDALRSHLLAARQARRADMLDRLDAVDVEKLGRRLESVLAAVSEAQTPLWRRVLGKRLLRRAKRLCGALEETGQLYVPDRLHQVRIASKKLRYGLELAADSGVKSAAPLVRALKRVQEQLGQLQDVQVLRQHVAELQAQDASRRLPRGALDALSQQLDVESRRLHGRFLRAAPSITAVVADVRRSVVPELAHRARGGSQLRMPLRRAPRDAAAGSR